MTRWSHNRFVAFWTALMLALILLTTKCVSNTHVKGDDATIAQAVQSEKVLFNLADTFFKLEDSQQRSLEKVLPGIHAYAEQARLEVPRVLETLRTFTKVYRESPANAKPNMTPVLARSTELSVALQGWLAKIAEAK